MYENILNKPESYRRKVAIFSSVFIFMLVVGAWGGVNGFWSGPEKVADAPKKVILVTRTDEPEPTETIGKSFSSAFNAFKESLASVFVPFMTGIEIYESGEK